MFPLESATSWEPPPLRGTARPHLEALRACLDGHVPEEGLGCTILGVHNALAVHAQPALEAIDHWLAGNALGNDAAQLIGLGPGLTPSGDDYLGGVLVALRALGRDAQADALWRWLEPRSPRAPARSARRTSRPRPPARRTKRCMRCSRLPLAGADCSLAGSTRSATARAGTRSPARWRSAG